MKLSGWMDSIEHTGVARNSSNLPRRLAILVSQSYKNWRPGLAELA